MKKLLRTLILANTLINLNYQCAQAVEGGQITWVCQLNGKYKFKLLVYQACEGGNPSEIGTGVKTLCVYNHPIINQIVVNEISNREISSPSCGNIATAIKCGNNKLGAMQEIFYESADIDLGNYTPGVNGWVFSYSNCCMLNGLINTTNSGFTLRTIMYAYQGKKAKPCYDNSPMFTETPLTILAKGQTFNYNPNASDYDGDFLSVEWAKPMNDVWTDGSSVSSTGPTCHAGSGLNHWKENGTSTASHADYITFKIPFNYTNPIRAIAVGTKPILNTATGEFNFRVNDSIADGNYIFTFKTTAYRQGIKIAEVYRSSVVTVYPTQTNTLPTIAPITFYKNGVQATTGYEINAVSGDVIEFDIATKDTITQQQTVTLSGIKFNTLNGTVMYDATTLGLVSPCNNPSCNGTDTVSNLGASFVLTSANPFAPIVGGTGYGAITGHFKWKVPCNSSNSDLLPSTFTFMFKVFDNSCKVAGITYQQVRINIKPTLNTTVNVSNDSIIVIQAGVNYQWIDCTNGNTPITGATSQYYVPTTTGSYAVQLTDSSCTYTSNCVNFVITSVTNKLASYITLTPNPTNGYVRVNLGPQKATVYLTELNGKQLEVTNAEGSATFNLTNLANGMYIIKVRTATETLSYKVVKN